MRSVKRRFKNIQRKNLDWSSYTCFFKAIERQNFSVQTIPRWFNKLVEKDDYALEEKKAILANLYDATKCTEDNKKLD